ncbi:hypothetical protein WA158_000920 [Blastocystis sp. Blastoise]
MSNFNPDRTVYFQGVDKEYDEQDVIQVLSESGQISKIKIAKDPETSICFGYGFCEYINTASANDALKRKRMYSKNGVPVEICPLLLETKNLFNSDQYILKLPQNEVHTLLLKMKDLAQKNPYQAFIVLSMNPRLCQTLLTAEYDFHLIKTPVPGLNTFLSNTKH